MRDDEPTPKADEGPVSPDRALLEELGIPYAFDEPGRSICYASYDPEQRQLVVEFRGSGGVKYGHDGVPVDLWIEFYQAVSKGGYYNAAIRPFYQGKSL